MALKLGYWKEGGLAEPIRILLHVLVQEYENVTYEKPQDWFSLKKIRVENGDNFVNLPYLEDGDVFISETGAIPYYLCQKFNKDLYGKNVLDTTRIIQINGVINDLHRAIIFPAFTENPKENVTEAVKEGSQYVGLVAKLATFLGEKEFLLDYLTYADIRLAFKIFFHRSIILSFDLEDPFAKHPNLLQYTKKIYEHDILKGYIGSENQYTPLDLPWFNEHPLP